MGPSAHERELTAVVLGAMVRDLAAAECDRDGQRHEGP
jgi:hypothetical protein